MHSSPNDLNQLNRLQFKDSSESNSLNNSDEDLNNQNTNIESNNNHQMNSQLNNNSNSIANLHLSNSHTSNRDHLSLSIEGQLNEQFYSGLNLSLSDEPHHIIEDLLEHLKDVTKREREVIQNEKDILINAQIEFNEANQQREIKHKKETDQWGHNLSVAEFLCCPDNEIYDFNIGGTNMITVSKRTLTKYPESSIAKMFNGKNKLTYHNGRIFIDRDGKVFNSVIHYLRNETIPLFINAEDKENFYEEMNYWQIPIKGLQTKPMASLFEFDEDWCAETLAIESRGKIVKKNNIQHGIIFLKPQFTEENYSIRLKVIISKPSRGKSHLFIGLVDKTKYKHEDLLSTFWKDSPSSYYWDIWNLKLIKTDSNGFQVETFEGYGCQCEETKTTITMQYDAKMKTIKFYKNNIDLGVAFRNVPDGLTPSLDIWFESGIIEVKNDKKIKDKIYLQ